MFLILSTLSLFSSAIHAKSIDSEALYQEFCSVCHGDKGDGNSHARQGMVPPPRDFTSPQAAVELDQGRVLLAIREGVPATAMSGWKTRFSEPQITALADFIQTKFMSPATIETATQGSRIYANSCSVCHGDAGKGALWATTGLSPPPADFSDKKTNLLLTRERMIRSVSYGRAETAMNGWKNRLTDDQISIVVDYVINAFMPGSPAALAFKKPENKIATATPESTHADMSRSFPDNLQGNLKRGTPLYMANCSICHGVKGDGRGPRAYFINPKPRNFLHTSSRASFNRPTLFKTISKGKLRTEMPAWEKVLSDQQIADVSEFVFNTFINP